MQSNAKLDDRLAGSVPFCTMLAVAVAGWQLMKQMQFVSDNSQSPLARVKPITCRFFLDRIVPQAKGLKAEAKAGANLLYAVSAEALAG